MTIQNNLPTKYIVKSILFCTAFTLLLVVFSFAKGFIPNDFERLAHGVIGTIAAFLTTVLFLKLDKKQFADIGLTFERTTIIKFLVGVIMGAVIMGCLASGVIYFTNLRIQVNRESDLLHFLLFTTPLIPLAFMEELGFRGYPLQTLQEKTGVRWSIIITSILFALYHIANGWSVASSFYGPAIWGLVFGLAAIYSRGIAMPTGIHYAANLTTSAFGEANNTISIWILKQTNKSSTKHEGISWATILPAFFLFVFAIVCTEIYMRKKNNGRSHTDQKIIKS